MAFTSIEGSRERAGKRASKELVSRSPRALARLSSVRMQTDGNGWALHNRRSLLLNEHYEDCLYGCALPCSRACRLFCRRAHRRTYVLHRLFRFLSRNCACSAEDTHMSSRRFTSRLSQPMRRPHCGAAAASSDRQSGERPERSAAFLDHQTVTRCSRSDA
jgi:hypothetical protein